MGSYKSLNVTLSMAHIYEHVLWHTETDPFYLKSLTKAQCLKKEDNVKRRKWRAEEMAQKLRVLPALSDERT